jgi:hypothetical protein
MFRHGTALLCVVSGATPALSPAAETAKPPARYELQGCALELAPPVEVGRAKGHFWFSTLHSLGGSDVLCEVVLSDDKAQGKWPAVLYLSRDAGGTWRRARETDSYGPVSTLLGPGKVLLMPYECWPLAPNDKRNAVADGTLLTLAADGALTAEATPVKYLDFPRDLAEYNTTELYLLTNGNILPTKDNRLFTTVYGRRAGEAKDCVWAVTSDDGGRTWHYQATVADGVALGTPEGANESNSIRLADGRLLCVYRTGAEYHKSYSADEGATWTGPEPLAGVRAVEPQLVRLANGVILLSGGRPGLFLWACTDGEGKTWQRVSLGTHHNRHLQDASQHYSDAFCEGGGGPALSTSYTGMVAIGSDEVLVCYDRLGNEWRGAPGPQGEWDAVFSVRVKVTRE